ncbi:complement C3-like, partial, partial [Tachysurus ichikawai]
MQLSSQCSLNSTSMWTLQQEDSKPVLKKVKTWPAGATSALKDCFECTDWDIFREAATNGNSVNLEEYMALVTSFTNYKTASPACDSDASLPDALNNFYARFEAQNNVTARKAIPPPEDQVLCISTADVRRTL